MIIIWIIVDDQKCQYGKPTMILAEAQGTNNEGHQHNFSRRHSKCLAARGKHPNMTLLANYVTLWLCQNSYWKWKFIVSFPIDSMVIFHSYVSLPEGNSAR